MFGDQGSSGGMLRIEVESSQAPLQALLARLPTIGQFADLGAEIGVLRTAGEFVEQISQAGQWLLGCLTVGEVLGGVGFASCQPQGPSQGIPQFGIFLAKGDCGGEPPHGHLGMSLHQFQTPCCFECCEIVRMRVEPAGELVAGESVAGKFVASELVAPHLRGHQKGCANQGWISGSKFRTVRHKKTARHLRGHA